MDPILAASLISGGSRLLGGLLGGGKQTTQYEMSPEQRRLYQLLMGEYGAKTPSWIKEEIAPQFDIMRNLVTQRMTGMGMGQSGNLISALMGVEAKRGREIGIRTGQYKQNLLRLLTGVTGGTGMRTTQTGADWGGIAGGVGGDINFMLGLQAFLKSIGQNQFGAGGGAGAGTGMQYSPGFLGG